MSWDDVGDAIQAAVQRASGLDAGRVVWKNQNRGAPDHDYVAIDLGSVLTVGIDYLHAEQDLTRARGFEIELQARGLREVPLEIECFTVEPVAARSGSALALCGRILSGLILPSVRDILEAQSVSPFDPGAARWIPDVPSTNFRGRATATVRCYMPAPTVSEYVGYIDRVTGLVIRDGSAAIVESPFDTDAAR